MSDSDCLLATRRWIEQVVVGLDLCPFAAPVLRLDALAIRAISGNIEICLQALAQECRRFETQERIDTVLLVLEYGYRNFDDYLDLLDLCQQLLDDSGYAIVLQLASFHPCYQFSGTAVDAVENYTNRSPYPILQLLRERSVSRALSNFADPQQIPERNIARMQELGIAGITELLSRC